MCKEGRKFKVGDRVVALSNSLLANCKGKYGRILKIENNYGVEFDENVNGHNCASFGSSIFGKVGHCAWLSEEDLEFEAKTPNWKVVIIPEGDKTIGRLYENNKVVKSVETTRHPEDEYSIEEACKVVMGRMFGADVKEVKRPAKVGEYIKIVNDKFWNNGEYRLGDILKVVRFYGNPEYGDVSPINLRTNKETVYVKLQEYVVLENYKEEPKEEPKPTYYNGKVVCLSDHDSDFTFCKVYTVTEGIIKTDDSHELPLDTSCKFRTFEDLVEYFASYGDRKKSFTAHWCGEGVKFIEVVE